MNYITARKAASSDPHIVRPPGLRVLRQVPSAEPADDNADLSKQLRAEREARLRVIVSSFVGVVMLIIGQWLQPNGGTPITGPPDGAAWLATACGIIGIWLVPGVWPSALILRTGTGPIAALTTRVGVLLGWYSLAGVVVYYSAQGARPTAGSLIGVTAAATAAACLGVALGFLRHPLDHRWRFAVFAAVGGLCAEAAIWLAMHFWTYQINYQHIRRLDWVIVLVCALLTALGQANPPTLQIRDPARTRRALAGLTAMTVTAVLTVATALTWPTTQQQPAELAAEQVSAPAGADIAFALTEIGPGPGERGVPGLAPLRNASFTATDDLGRSLSAQFQIVHQGNATDAATLLIVLAPTARPILCWPIGRSSPTTAVKVTLRDQSSGMSAQAVLPPTWCGQ